MNPSSTRTSLLVCALLLIGLAQMFGALVESPTLKGLAAATAASPAPKVFSSVEGLETFSTTFSLEWTLAGDTTLHELPLTHAVYPKLRGPYNRRNIWGAMLAYGPALDDNPLTRQMFEDIMHYGLCNEAPVLVELGIEPGHIDALSIVYTPRDGTNTHLPMRIERRCKP